MSSNITGGVLPQWAPLRGNSLPTKPWFRLVLLLVAGLTGHDAEAASRPSLSLTTARYHQNQLTVVGTYKAKVLPADGRASLYDRKLGRLLGEIQLAEIRARKQRRTFRLTVANPYDIPCSVRVSAPGARDKFRAVRGAPKKNCSTGKTPPVVQNPVPTPAPVPTPTPTPTPTPSPSPGLACAILEPAGGAGLTANQPVTFRGRVVPTEASSGVTKWEWDFAGGALERPTGNLTGAGDVTGQATFVRHNSTYRVRLSAIDALNRRCEAAVTVQVGIPPGVPGNVAALAAAAQQSAPPAGYALQKPAGDAVVLPYDDWSMQCGSDTRLTPNVIVPYGPQVHNLKAVVYEKAQKPVALGSDAVRLRYSAASNPKDPVGSDSINATSQNWPLGKPLKHAEIAKTDLFERRVRTPEQSTDLAPDYFSASWLEWQSWQNLGTAPPKGNPDEGFNNSLLPAPLNTEKGRAMPGIQAPYAANDPQPFNGYDGSDASFIASLLPLSDVDDAGRVNPYPLFRVDAQRKGSDAVVAGTDITMNVGRDLRCRECHAKGKMAAQPGLYDQHEGHGDGHGHSAGPLPVYVDPESPSLFDQEYAALKNLSALHDYNHGGTGRDSARIPFMKDWMDSGGKDLIGRIGSDHPDACTSCHQTPITKAPLGGLTELDSGTNGGFLTDKMHLFHDYLRYNADHSDVLRDEFGKPIRGGAAGDRLFPVKDVSGKPLPMEQNCLRCHGGQREQCYRDRMYTAGVTCYQCHGDMRVVEGYLEGQENLPWFDQPNCGSCHTGDGNQGKEASGEFFSAGVRTLAFDEVEFPAVATPRQPNPTDPVAQRFAVPRTFGAVEWRETKPLSTSSTSQFKKVGIPALFRAGKDAHGNVPCAACHGAAHGIWPNRDPNANDNVTATQLQGHSGHLVECGVCHSADAFTKLKNLDAGRFTGLPEDSGILGGPHNMHPVNEPTWWLQVGTSADGYGGWHDDVYRRPGFKGVDQCAACHGTDHAGTRLSKAAVDRSFVLPTGITATWKAGQPIGCDQCHTLEHSFKGAPAGNGPQFNRPPTFNSTPVEAAVPGKTYRYQAKATDPDSHPLKYALILQPMVAFDGLHFSDSLQIDPQTGVVTGSFDPALLTNAGTAPPLGIPYIISARDGFGGFAQQTVTVKLDCPVEHPWDGVTCKSPDIDLQPDPSAPAGLNGGETFVFQPQATRARNLPLNFRVVPDQPGVSVDPKTGKITAKTNRDSAVTTYVTVTLISTDTEGGEARLSVSASVCGSKEVWDGANGICQGPVVVTEDVSTQGARTGETWSYKIHARQRNGLPLTFRVTQGPPGLSVDRTTGELNWLPTSTDLALVTISVIDSEGSYATAAFSVAVCTGREQFNAVSGHCDQPVTLEQPTVPLGANVGAPVTYQFKATDRDQQTLTYSLKNAKPAMSIDSATGQFTWTPTDADINAETKIGTANFDVIATATDGSQASLTGLEVHVCGAPKVWKPDLLACSDP